MVTAGRHSTRARRSLLRRMALIFMGAVAATALALALAAYLLTKSDQDSRALSDALDQTRLNLTVADSILPVSPGPADYTALMAAFELRGDFDTLMEVRAESRPYVSGPDVTRAPITDALAAKVAEGRIGYQIVTVHGEPTLIVGSQIRAGEVTVYFFFPQAERFAQLARLRTVLIATGIVLAALGAVGGYLLARRLLRPVRAASRAAMQMSHGDLDIRLPEGPDEFGILAASFNQMAENLQTKMLDLEASQARERRFVADVTHELRTPVSALVGEASLLKTRLEAEPSQASPEVRRLAVLVDRDIARLRQLVDDLLEISRLEAHAAETVIESVDLSAFLARLVQAHGWTQVVRVLTEANAVGNKPSDVLVGPVALADKRRLERVLVNLIQNALHHGSPPITVEARMREPLHDATQRVADIAVTDSGPGISTEHLPHIFDRFYKADPSRSSGRGSGLGLAIARENARLMGGDVTAANVPGGGARFVVTLPVADAEPL